MEPVKDLSAYQFPSESIWSRLWRSFVLVPVFAWQDYRCRRARAYLLTHDEKYRSMYIGNEVVRQRNILYDKGASPIDPSIPDIWDVDDELPPRAWPRVNHFGD